MALTDYLALGAGLLDVGGSIYGATRNRSNDQALINYVQAKQAEQDARNQQIYEYNKQASAASARAGAARAAAANATNANARVAAKKAQKVLNAGYKSTMNLFDPYAKMAALLAPAMQNTYQAGLSGLGDLFGKVSGLPISSSVASWKTGVPIPEYLAGADANKKPNM